MELIDQILVDSCPENEALKLIQIALLCVQADPNLRPTMSSVLLLLTSKSIDIPRPLAPTFTTDRLETSEHPSPIGAGAGFATSDQSSTSGVRAAFATSDQS